MTYELFNRKKGHLGRGIYLAITNQGTIRLSHSCYEKYFKEFKWVHFYYDKKINRIGIKPINKEDIDAYQIRKTKAKSSVIYSLSAVSFLKYYGVDFSKVRKIEPVWDKEEKMLKFSS